TFSGMVRTGPDGEIEADLSLADLELATGVYGAAEKDLGNAIQAAVRNHNHIAAAKAQIEMAELQIQKDLFLQANQQLGQVSLPPQSPALMLLLARTYAWTGSLEPARRSLRDIDAQINQHDAPALQALHNLVNAEIALAQKRFPDAVEAAESAVTYQKSVFAIETLARCYAAAGMQEKAVQQYQIVITRGNELMDDARAESFDEPAFHRAVDAHYRLGVLYQKLGRWDDARTELQKFLGYWTHADADVGIYQDAQRLLRSLPTGSVPTPAR
ncbi:MAG TPA: tetratricopeptide repeat protein, partial [Acidobacteriaceae bacterium]